CFVALDNGHVNFFRWNDLRRQPSLKRERESYAPTIGDAVRAKGVTTSSKQPGQLYLMPKKDSSADSQGHDASPGNARSLRPEREPDAQVGRQGSDEQPQPARRSERTEYDQTATARPAGAIKLKRKQRVSRKHEPTAIGTMFRDWRIDLEITQAEACRRIGVHQSHLSRVELGE